MLRATLQLFPCKWLPWLRVAAYPANIVTSACSRSLSHGNTESRIIQTKTIQIFYIAPRNFHSHGANYVRGARNRQIAKDMPSVANDKQLLTATKYLPSQVPGIDTEITPLDNIIQLLQTSKSRELTEKNEKEISECIIHMKPKEIFHTLQYYHNNLTKTHYALALKHLVRIYRKLPEDSQQGYKDLLYSHDGFKLLCALLALKGEHYEPEIMADMLKFLHTLGLDSEHPTMKVYLQLLSHALHRLHLSTLISIMDLTKDMNMTSQVKVLREGIRVLCRGQVVKGIPVLNIVELLIMLDQLGDSLAKDDLDQVINEITADQEKVMTKLSVPLLRGLRHLKEPNFLEEHAVRKIIKKTQILTFEEIIDILDSCLKIDLYHYELFHKISDHAIVNYNIHKQLQILSYFYKFIFLSKDLLTDFMAKLEVDLSLLNQEEVLETLDVLADASHKMKLDVQNILPELISKLDETYIQQLSAEKRLKGLCNLHILGQGHSGLASTLFTKGTVDYFKERQKSPEGGLPLGHACEDPLCRLATLASSGQYSVDNMVMQGIEQDVRKMPIPAHTVAMGNMLIAAMETEDSVVTRPRCQKGLIIDHELLLDQDERCVNLQHYKASLEDWQVDKDYRRIAVYEFPRPCFHRNTRQLRGYFAWYLRHVQSVGYYVVLVNSTLFEEVDDQHKFEYLRLKMRNAEKFQDLVILN